MEGDGSVAVSCSIVEELGDGNGCGFSAFGLGRGERSESDEHGGVDGACIIQQGAEDFLNAFGIAGVKCWGSVRCGDVLGFGAILDGFTFVG